MITATLATPAGAGLHLYRFSVDEYHRMIRAGVFDGGKRVELLNGWVVEKMTHNPPHDSTIQNVDELVRALLPAGWCVRIQSAITLSHSEPEPDVCVARGDRRTYRARHPGPGDVGLAVEVADTTLPADLNDKAGIYARAGLPVYWVVNLVDRQVEVFTDPSGPATAPAYAQHQVFRPGGSVPLVLGGTALGQISVDELLP